MNCIKGDIEIIDMYYGIIIMWKGESKGRYVAWRKNSEIIE